MEQYEIKIMAEKAPLISILTVTYNAEKEILPTLESIKAQTMTDYEFILMDGASKDRTLAIVRDAEIPGARIFSSPDNGIYHAMNKALAEASGEYVIFLNAGDSFHCPDTLRTVADAIKDNGYPGIVYGQTDIVDADRRRLGTRHLTAPEELTLKSFRNGMVVCHQAFYALRRFVPSFNTKYRFSADYEWCIQCLQHSRKNICVHEVLADYLQEGTTTRNMRRSLTERFRIMCYYYGTVPTIIRHIGFLFRFLKRKNKQPEPTI